MQKHGVNFAEAWRVYENQEKITLEIIRNNQNRLVDIAPVAGRLMVLVYVLRNECVWIISYRKAKHPKETRLYYDATTHRSE